MTPPLLSVLLVLSLLSAPIVPARAADIPARPNILFLLTDDQRWDTIHALGNPEIRTPTFDRLVAQGFNFSNAFCQGSMIGGICLPSRTMIVTGRSLWRIPPKMMAKTAPPGVPLLPTLLSDSGYVTFHCGKAGNACTFGNAAFQTNISTEKRSETSATELAGHAIEFLNKHDASKPFFMYLAPPVPHDPRLAPPGFAKMYDPAKVTLPKQFMREHPFDPGVLDIRDEKLAPYPRTPEDMRQHLADYYGTISHMDHEFGRVLDVLKQRGLAEKTVVIFSSDQGLACGGYHALMGKQNLYEDVKPPLIIAGPGIPHGRSGALVYLYDIFPTICDLAGVRVPAVVEGKSLLPVALGKTPRLRETLFGAYATVQRMVRDERWKLIEFDVKGRRDTLLFDLAGDPEEIHSLAASPAHAAELARLRAALAAARREFGDPVAFGGSASGAPVPESPGKDESGK